MIQLFIKHYIYNNPICIYVNLSDTIEGIKNRYNINNFTLYHKNVLENQHTIEHYGLSNNDTIHLFSNLSGGMDPIGGSSQPAIMATGLVNSIFDKISSGMTFAFDKMKTAAQVMASKLKWVKTLITIAKFFPIIVLVGMVIAFFTKPMEFLMLTFGLIFVVILYILYSILNLPPFIFLVAAIWFIIMDIIPLLIYCAIFTALLILIFLICLILTWVNVMTGGALKDIVLCDNSPGSWYKTANYHLGNKWERGIFCTRPCFSRYTPDTTGISCNKLPKGYPPYCPQAEIMRIYSTKKTDSNYKFENYNDKGNVYYMSKEPLKREEMLKKHYLHKRDFMNVCNKEMSNYNTIALNICASIDSLDLQPKDKLRLKQVCQQAYCTSEKNYPFCSKISELKEDDKNAIIKKVIKIMVIMIIFCLVFLFTMEYMYKK
jgi:hypothetical protein